MILCTAIDGRLNWTVYEGAWDGLPPGFMWNVLHLRQLLVNIMYVPTCNCTICVHGVSSSDETGLMTASDMTVDVFQDCSVMHLTRVLPWW